MFERLKVDHARFREMAKGKVRPELKKLFSSEDFWARPGGGKVVKIKVKDIEIPHIVYGKDQEGVGQGEGEVGDIIGTDPPEGPISTGGGSGAGEHYTEIEISYEELAEMIAQDLELPRLEPKGKKTLTTPYGAYTGVRPVGPESLLIRKRSYKRALKRSISSGIFSVNFPSVIMLPEDKRYRAQSYATRPYASAFVALLRDVSGSMGDNFNRVVNVVSRLFDFWLHQHYKGGVDVRYFWHDTDVFEVTQEVFYQMSRGGGTMFSKAYKHISKVIDQDHPVNLWNNYVVHFTDGDVFQEDVSLSQEVMMELIPKTNLFAYFEVLDSKEKTMWSRPKDALFGASVKALVDEFAPRFKVTDVDGPEDAYEKFRGVLI